MDVISKVKQNIASSSALGDHTSSVSKITHQFLNFLRDETVLIDAQQSEASAANQKSSSSAVASSAPASAVGSDSQQRLSLRMSGADHQLNTKPTQNGYEADFPALPPRAAQAAPAGAKPKKRIAPSVSKPTINSLRDVEQHISSKEALDNATEVYSSLILNKCVPSLLSELQLLVRMLAVPLTSRNTSSTSSSSSNSLHLFQNGFDCTYFALKVLLRVQVLVVHLGDAVIRSLMENSSISRLCPDLHSALKKAVSHRSPRGNRTIAERPEPDYASAARTETRQYKQPEETNVFNNREKCRDQFFELLRSYSRPDSSRQFPLMVRLFIDLLFPVNTLWFAELFISQLLLQREGDPDPALRGLADPEKLRKLNYRISSTTTSGFSLERVDTSSAAVDKHSAFFFAFLEYSNNYIITMSILRSVVSKLSELTRVSSAEQALKGFAERVLHLKTLSRLLAFMLCYPDRIVCGTDLVSTSTTREASRLTQTAMEWLCEIRRKIRAGRSAGCAVLQVVWVVEFLKVAAEDPYLKNSEYVQKALRCLVSLYGTFRPAEITFNATQCYMMLEIEAMFESLKIDPTSLGSSAEDDDVDFDEFDRSAWSDRSLIPSPTPSTNPAHDPLARSILSSSSTSAEIRNSALSAPLSSSATRPITNSSSSNNALSANSASPKLFLHLDVLPGLIDSRFLEMNAPGALAALTAAITKTNEMLMHKLTSSQLVFAKEIKKITPSQPTEQQTKSLTLQRQIRSRFFAQHPDISRVVEFASGSVVSNAIAHALSKHLTQQLFSKYADDVVAQLSKETSTTSASSFGEQGTFQQKQKAQVDLVVQSASDQLSAAVLSDATGFISSVLPQALSVLLPSDIEEKLGAYASLLAEQQAVDLARERLLEKLRTPLRIGIDEAARKILKSRKRPQQRGGNQSQAPASPPKTSAAAAFPLSPAPIKTIAADQVANMLAEAAAAAEDKSFVTALRQPLVSALQCECGTSESHFLLLQKLLQIWWRLSAQIAVRISSQLTSDSQFIKNLSEMKEDTQKSAAENIISAALLHTVVRLLSTSLSQRLNIFSIFVSIGRDAKFQEFELKNFVISNANLFVELIRHRVVSARQLEDKLRAAPERHEWLDEFAMELLSAYHREASQVASSAFAHLYHPLEFSALLGDLLSRASDPRHQLQLRAAIALQLQQNQIVIL